MSYGKTVKLIKGNDTDDEEQYHRHRHHHQRHRQDAGSDTDGDNHCHGRKKTPSRTRDFGASDNEGGRDVEESRDVSDSSRDLAATEQVRNVVNLYTQIAANTELQQLRNQSRGLFDTLLQHAVPFALNAAQSALGALGNKRDVGVDDVAIHQHLPTAINFAHQINSIPEVQENRGFFDKIFSIGMPLVLNTAQTLLGAKRDIGTDDGSQRGFFDAIVGQLPGAVFDVLSGGRRDVGGEEDRGFFDILKKVAPIVMNVAGSAIQSLQGQRSLSFAPTDRGFFDKIKNIAKKIINNPIVKKIGGTVLNVGLSALKSGALGPVGKMVGGVAGAALGRDIDASPEVSEAHVRGFFGSMLQTLTPIAMGALQGAIGAAGRKRDLAVTPAERGIFDLVAQALPAVIQVAHTAYSRRRGVGEDESAYLQRVISTTVGPIIAGAKEQAESGVDRGFLGNILGGLLPF